MRVTPFWSIWSPQRSPKRPPRAPKRSPKELQNDFKTILTNKKSIFQKIMNVSAKTKVFEVLKVILEVQNRPKEAPREDKQTATKKKDTEKTK